VRSRDCHIACLGARRHSRGNLPVGVHANRAELDFRGSREPNASDGHDGSHRAAHWIELRRHLKENRVVDYFREGGVPTIILEFLVDNLALENFRP
jgi:hypothetical protein